MKIAIITDSHFGVKGDNLVFADYISRFFREVFLPYLVEHGITHVIHCGDIVERRKYINFLTARTLQEALVRPLADAGIDVTWIIGNHDIYFKETNQINSMHELYGDRIYKNMRIVENPQTIVLWDKDGIHAEPIDCYPWINKENEADAYELMRNPKSKIALGHFEFAGFEMQKGQVIHSGMDYQNLAKYLFVGSGHFHERSRKGNVQYFGCPYQLTWADYGCERGFHILDTDTLELQFIENPITIFERIEYDDSKDSMLEKPLPTLKGKIVKVVVLNKTKPDEFDQFMSTIEQQWPFSLKVVEDLIKVELNEVDVEPTEDTLSVLVKYANVAETSQRNRLVNLVTRLYNKALENQIVE